MAEVVEQVVVGKAVYFPKIGQENTEEVLHIAKERADELGIKTILVATTRGDTGARAVEVFKGMKVVVVTHATDMSSVLRLKREVLTKNLQPSSGSS